MVLDEPWFDMRSTARAKLAAGVWIPLHIADDRSQGHYPHIGHWSDRHDVQTAAVALSDRARVAALAPSALCGDCGVGPEATPYRSVDAAYHEDWTAGVRLALVQTFVTGDPEVWSLHPDLVFALGLKQEGDRWLRPEEGYCEVAELRRNDAGEPWGLFIKPDFLGDYLAARSMVLHIYQSRHRRGVTPSPDPFGWGDDPVELEVHGGRLCRESWPAGGQIGVLKIYRTDQWDEDELPMLSAPVDENVVVEEDVIHDPVPLGYAVDTWFERREWFEPAAASPRVRGDAPVSPISFIIEPSGATTPASLLDDEDIGRWLWFSPGVIPELISRRRVSVEWTGLETGEVGFAGSYSVAFGDNGRDKVVVYARDIARLPPWQQSLWRGFNIVPDGGLPLGLTIGGPSPGPSPEAVFAQALASLDEAAEVRWGKPLFRGHDERGLILARVHRYRALDQSGLLSLAKDMARLTADSLDTELLWKLVPLAKAERRGSLKSLERALATLVGKTEAHDLMSALFAVYDLRLADAHLPSAALTETLSKLGVDPDMTPLKQGRRLLQMAGLCLLEIAIVVQHPS